MSSPNSGCRGEGKVFVPPCAQALPSGEEAVAASGLGCEGVCLAAGTAGDQGPCRARSRALAQLVCQGQVESSSAAVESKV